MTMSSKNLYVLGMLNARNPLRYLAEKYETLYCTYSLMCCADLHFYLLHNRISLSLFVPSRPSTPARSPSHPTVLSHADAHESRLTCPDRRRRQQRPPCSCALSRSARPSRHRARRGGRRRRRRRRRRCGRGPRRAGATRPPHNSTGPCLPSIQKGSKYLVFDALQQDENFHFLSSTLKCFKQVRA